MKRGPRTPRGPVRPGDVLPVEKSYAHGCLGGDDQLELRGRTGLGRAAGGPELAVHAVGVPTHGIAPRVDQVAGRVIDQPDPLATVGHAHVQALGDGDGSDVQPDVRRSHASHGPGVDRLRPGERPFG